MSKLGYIDNSYGKQIKVAIANTYGSYVLSGSNLPVNTIIVSSPIDDENNDIGTYSLFITDSLSNPIRLTYSISEGNGLNYSKETDSLKLNIDNDTIIESNNKLSVNIKNIIDNNTIQYTNNKINVNIDNLNKLTDNQRGLFKIDEKTIKSDEGKLYIDTENLRYVNQNTSNGICIGDGKTIFSNQGILSVNQTNLTVANEQEFGIVSGNSNNIKCEDGTISVVTSTLDKCNSNNGGIVKVDNLTITLNENHELHINTNNLNKLSSSNSGVFKYDNNIFDIKDNSLTIKNTEQFDKKIKDIADKNTLLLDKINEVKYLLTEYEVGVVKPQILDFHCCDPTSSILEKTFFLNQIVDEMKYQYITTDFIVSTNCPFFISVKFENNIDPCVSLFEINYNDKHKYNGNNGLIQIYQSTEERKVPIKFTFIAKNYFNNNIKDFSNKVKIKITVSYAYDITINKSVLYSIVRFNSGYNEEIEYNEVNINKLTVKKALK